MASIPVDSRRSRFGHVSVRPRRSYAGALEQRGFGLSTADQFACAIVSSLALHAAVAAIGVHVMSAPPGERPLELFVERPAEQATAAAPPAAHPVKARRAERPRPSAVSTQRPDGDRPHPARSAVAAAVARSATAEPAAADPPTPVDPRPTDTATAAPLSESPPPTPASTPAELASAAPPSLASPTRLTEAPPVSPVTADAASVAPSDVAVSTHPVVAAASEPATPPESGSVPTPDPVSEPVAKPAAPVVPSADAPPSKPAAETPIPRPPSAPAVAAGPEPRGSSIGLGLGVALAQFDGPRRRVTDRPTESVSGRVVGSPTRVVLRVNGTEQDLVTTAGSFDAVVPLSRGTNRVHLVAHSASGAEAEDVLTIQYVPRVAVTITAPRDGYRLSSDDLPIVTIEGDVSDAEVTAASLVVNGTSISVPVVGGRFRQAVLVTEPVLRFTAEAQIDGVVAGRSGTVTIHGAPPSGTIGIVRVDRPRNAAGVAEVTADWRSRSDTLDWPVQTLAFTPFPARQGVPPELFYLRGLKPGVYTLAIRYRSADPADAVRPRLYLPVDGRWTVRTLPAIPPNGHGAAIAKVLLPQGVFWEQDDWFSGRSEAADTVTKFRFPEGVSWIERKSAAPAR